MEKGLSEDESIERERRIARTIEDLHRLGVTPEEAADRLRGQRARSFDLDSEDFTPTIGGKRHFCTCGVGVFRRPRGNPLLFVCNGCGDVWEGSA